MRVLICGGRDLDSEDVRHRIEAIAIEHFPRLEPLGKALQKHLHASFVGSPRRDLDLTRN